MTAAAMAEMASSSVPQLRERRGRWSQVIGRGSNRLPKVVSNEPFPGCNAYPFRNGQWIAEADKDSGPYITIYAGSVKAAYKKARLLAKLSAP